MMCSLATYEEKADALMRQRQFLTRSQLYSSIEFCERCDGYHVLVRDFKANTKEARYTVPVLKHLAMGFTMIEIAAILGTTDRTIEKYTEKAMRRLYAQNRVNLVAICIAHGILRPEDFVPDIKEKVHA